MKNAYSIIGLLLLILALSDSAQRNIVNGYDWQLPRWVKETPKACWACCNAGIVQRWEQTYPIDAPVDEIYFAAYYYLTRHDVHKGQGQFNWSQVDAWVASIEKTPHLGFAFFTAAFARILTGDRQISGLITILTAGYWKTVTFTLSGLKDACNFAGGNDGGL